MVSRFLAGAVLVIHLAFIVFVVAGGLFLLRRPRLSCPPWLNLPAVFPSCHLSCCL
jgi:hypothetical protein